MRITEADAALAKRVFDARPAAGRATMMSEEHDESRGFKVQDRRRFTAEGETRDESEAQAAAPADEADKPAAETQAREAAAGTDQHADVPHELTFSSFVIGLASQAFVFLGAMPDPQSGATRRDLPQAKAMIDILSMLAEKTAGNLDEHESHMMDEMLYELRMHYVKELRAGTPEGGRD